MRARLDDAMLLPTRRIARLARVRRRPCSPRAPARRRAARRVRRMRRVSFRLPADEKEELLDALMPLLPAGVRERPVEDGEVELTTIAAAPPAREALEAAVGRTLAGWDSRRRAGGLARAARAVRRRGVPRRRPHARALALGPAGRGGGARPRARARRRRVRIGLALDDAHVPRAAARARSGGRRGRPRLRARHARDRGCPARLGSGGRGRPDGRSGLRRARERRPQRRRRRLARRRSRVGRRSRWPRSCSSTPRRRSTSASRPRSHGRPGIASRRGT